MPLPSHSSGVEVCPACDAEWRTEADRYRQALVDLLEVAEDMRAYVPEFFAQKWKHDDGLAAAREVLSR